MRTITAAAFAAAITAFAAPAFAGDDFNRPDAGTLGDGWTQQAGTSFISGNEAGGSDLALATFDAESGADTVSVDVSLTDDGTAYIAAVLGWGSDLSYFVKVQNNGGAGGFDRGGFYTGNNDSLEFFTLDQVFVSGRITVSLNGSIASLDITPDVGAAQHYEYDYANVFSGGGVGLGFFGGARADNFNTVGAAIPEPATWGLMLVGFGGMGALIRRRRVALAA